MDDFCQYKLYKKKCDNLFSPPCYARESEGKREKKVSNLELKSSDPVRLLLFCESLKQSATRELEVYINTYLAEESNSSLVFLINLMIIPNIAVIRVIGKTILNLDIHLPVNDELISTIIESKNGIEFSIELLNPQLLEVIKSVEPGIEGPVYAFPVFSQIHNNGRSYYTDDVQLLVCIVNCNLQKIFVCNLVQETFRFVLTLLMNTAKMEEETRRRLQYESVMNMIKRLFTKLDNFYELYKEVEANMLELTDSDKCNIYLADKHKEVLEELPYADYKDQQIKVPKDRGIQGMVFTTGQIININDAYNSSLFNKSMDTPYFKTKNILAFPLTNMEDIVGVAFMRNKHIGEFNHFDEECVELVGMVSGICMVHTLFYEKMSDELLRHRFTNDLQQYHQPIKVNEVKHIYYAQKPHYEDFGSVLRNPRLIPSHQYCLLVLKMFEDLNFIDHYGLNKKALSAFIATVEKAHRQEPFHNWIHSFCATYFAYAAIKSYGLMEKKYIGNMEAMALLTALMCLNLDFRSQGGMFRGMPWTTLNALYASNESLRERYCLSQIFVILNTEGCNFLEDCKPSMYNQFLQILQFYTMHCNLTSLFQNTKKLEFLVTRGFRPNILDDRKVFHNLLLVCCIISDQIRDWRNQRRVMSVLYEELFMPMDVEKIEGKQLPIAMAREGSCIPNLQLDFLRDTCLPAYTVLAKIIPESVHCVEGVLLNMRFWEVAKRFFVKRPPCKKHSLDLLAKGVLSYTESQLRMLGEGDDISTEGEEEEEEATNYDTTVAEDVLNIN